MYQSQPLSVEFWCRLLARLEQDFEGRSVALKSLLGAKSATVDTFALVQEQAARARQAAYAELDQLELMQALSQQVAFQVRQASFDSGIPALEQQIAGMRNVITLFRNTMCGLPSRTPGEQDLEHAVAQMAGLRNAGTGESVTAERQRLRAMTRDILVMGQEDGAEYEQAVRNLQTKLDQAEANLQTLRVSTLLIISVNEELAHLLINYGVEVAAVEVQLPAGEEA